jgi:hypothetical protein
MVIPEKKYYRAHARLQISSHHAIQDGHKLKICDALIDPRLRNKKRVEQKLFNPP